MVDQEARPGVFSDPPSLAREAQSAASARTVFDRVGLGGGLVLAVAEHPREAERDTAGISRAALHAVEGDLHDEFRADVHGPVVAVVRQLLQSRRLPCEQLVGEALERLAEHHPATGPRVAGAEMQVRQPPATPAVPPFHREHHEVQGVPRLHLDPPGAAAARRVRGGQGLDHHALVAVRERVAEERGRLVGGIRHQPGHQQLGRHDAGKRGVPLLVRQVDQVRAVEVQRVEQEHRERNGVYRHLARDAGGGVLEGIRPAVRAQRDQLAVEHGGAHGQLAEFGDHLGKAGRDVV